MFPRRVILARRDLLQLAVIVLAISVAVQPAGNLEGDEGLTQRGTLMTARRLI